MPEHIRALMVVLLLGGSVFFFARSAFEQVLPATTYSRWRNVWLLMTLALFLAHSFWIYALVVAGYCLATARRESHVLGLYFVVLCVAPPSGVEIPGFGLINHILIVNHYRLLSLVLLLPAAISLVQQSSTLKLGRSSVDWLIISYLVLISLLEFRGTNLTDGLRNTVTNVIDIFLPYYVVSRSIRDISGFKHALAGFALGAMVLSALSIFEVLRSWKLYSAVLGALGLNQSEFGGYLHRAGFLRPTVTVGNSIVLGYVIMVGLGFTLFLKEFIQSARSRWLGLTLLWLGVLSSLSRGPWVGAGAMLLVYVALGPNYVKKLMRLGVALLLVGVVLNQFPFGQTLLDILPFVGSVDEGNVEYRANLFTQALPVIERNFWFGSMDYLQTPELLVMMQGEGIVDIVNTYIGVALHVGMVGLLLFVGGFLLALKQTKGAMRKADVHGAEGVLLGRSLFATLVGIMLVIYTLSSILVVPVIYWCALGLCVAYAEWAKSPPLAPREAA